MADKIEILYVDDNPMDRSLVKDSLEREHGGFAITEAKSRKEFESIIIEKKFDFVLTDFNILGYEGLQVLETVQKKQPGVPVIIVTGTGSEEVAAESIKRGAADYVIKSPKHILRLPQTIKTVLDLQTAKADKEQREKELRESEGRYHQLIEYSPEAIVIHQNGKVVFANSRAFELMIDTNRDQLIGKEIKDILHPDNLTTAMTRIKKLLKGEALKGSVEYRLKRFDDTYFYAEITSALVKYEEKEAIQLIARDITDRKEREKENKKNFGATINLIEDLSVEVDRRKEAEEQLLTTAQDLKKAQEVAHVGSWKWYIQKNKVEWSDEMKRIWGLDPETFEGDLSKIIEESVLPEDLPKILKSNESVIKHKKPIPVEYRIKRPNGEIRYIYAEAGEVETDDNLRSVLLTGIAQDITERKLSEEALAKSEEKYRSIFENSALGIFRSTPEGRYEEVNPAFAQILGFESPEKMLNEVSDISKLYKYPEDREKIKEEFAEKGFVKDYQIVANHKDLETVWISVNAKAQTRKDGHTFYEGTVQDITEKKKAQEKLLENQRMLSSAQEIGKMGSWEIDIKTNIIKWTPQTYKIFEYPPDEEIDYDKFLECIHPDDRDFVNEEWIKGIENNSYDIEHRLLLNGEIKWVREKADLEFDSDGNPIKAQGFTQDITERKLADIKIKEVEEKYTKLFENMEDEVHLWRVVRDESEKIITWELVDANPAALKSWGKSKDQVIGKTTNQIFDFDAQNQFMPIIKKIFETGRSFSWESYFAPTDQFLSMESIPFGDFFISTGKDITERKLAEEKLRESKEEIARILENSMDGILVTAPDGSIHSANPSACKMFGRTEEEICKIGKEGVVDLSDPRLKEFLTIRKEKGKARGEVGLLRNDGSKFPAEVTSSLFKDQYGNLKSSMIIRDISDRKKAEEERRIIDERFRIAQDMSPDGFTILHPIKNKQNQVIDFSWIYENEAVAKMNGTDPKEIVGKRLLDLFPGHKNTQLMKNYQKVAESGKSLIFEESYKGETIENQIWFRLVVVPMGENIAILSQDTTERKKAEEKLKKSESFLSSLLESIPIPVFYKNKEGKYEGVNQAYEEFFGAKQEELVGKSVFDINPKELAEIYYEKDKSLFEIGGTQKYESEVKTVNGEIKNVIFNKAVYGDDSGNVNGLIGAILDITEERKSRKELQESEEKFRGIFENTLTAIMVADDKGNYLTVNDAAAELFGYSKEELENMNVSDLQIKSQPGGVERYNQYMKTGKETGELEFITGHLEERVAKYHAVRISQDFNLSMLYDITEEKKAEEKIKQSETDFKNLFQNVHDAVIVFDPEGEIILEANIAALKTYGFSREEFIGLSLRDIAKYPEKGDERVELVLSKGNISNFKTTQYHKNGSELKFEIYASKVQFKGKTAILTLNHDVTEKTKAEKALKESETKYRTFFENDLTGDYLSTPEGKLLDCNPAFAEMMGFDSIEEMLNTDTQTFYKSNKDREQFLKRLTKEKKIVNYESVIIRKDGKAINTVENVIGFFDDNGKLKQFQGYVIDITDKKLAEEKLIQSEANYRVLAESSQDQILVHDLEGKISYANNSFLELLEIKKEKIIGSSISILLNEEQQGEFQKNLTGFIKSAEKSLQFELIYYHGDGNEIILDIRATKLEQEGTTKSILLVCRDITKRKLEEEKVKKLSEAAGELTEFKATEDIFEFASRKVYEILNNQGVVISTTTNKKTFQWKVESIFGLGKNTEKILKIIGLSPEKLSGYTNAEDITKFESGKLLHIGEELDLDTAVSFSSKISKKLKSLLGFESIYTIQIDLDKNIYLNLSILKAKKTHFDNETIEIFTQYLSNYAQRLAITKEIKESEEKYRALFENQIEAFALYETIIGKAGEITDLKITDINEQFLSYTNMQSKSDLIGKRLLELWPNSDKKSLAFFDDILSTGEPKTFEQYSSDTKKYYKVNAYSPQKGFIATGVLDVTNEVKALNQLKESEEKYRNVVENSPVGIFQTTPEGEIVTVNNTMANILGFDSAEEALEYYKNKNLGEELYAESKKREEFVKLIKENRIVKSFEYDAITIEGNKIVIRMNAVITKDNLIEGFAEDVTEIKKAELELKKRMSELEIFNEAAVDRELMINDHRKEINDLLNSVGKEPKYHIVE